MNEIAGIKIPDSEICVATTDYCKRVSDPFLFNHVLRSYVFGEMVGQKSTQSYDCELFYVGAVLHDIGLTGDMPFKERFEIEGADAAREFLAGQGMDDKSIDIVWDAIALHTTLGVAQRKRPEIALVQTGAGIDVGAIPLDLIPDSYLEQILEVWPRLNFKDAITQTFGDIFKRSPMTAASHIVADVAERYVPGFQRFNICDAIHGAGFHE